MDKGLYIGLMSGTSVDGIDAALVRFGAQPQVLCARTTPLDPGLAAEVLRLSQADAHIHLDDLGRLDTRLGQALAQAALELVAAAGVGDGDVVAIGSHGQTLRHAPTGPHPFTLQLGDANIIAERTGLTTVADFRRRDVAAGGQGAPLVPAFHASVFGDAREDRAVLNLGGIANLTLLPARGTVRGFDTGPGNGLMDGWALRHTGARFDRGGALAAAGHVDAGLLEALLAEPWLALPAPKSTGRDLFNGQWLEARLDGRPREVADVQATLCRFTAVSVMDALRRVLPDCQRLLVCGGGVHNPVLQAELAARWPGLAIESTAAHGLDPDFVEAVAFAWLARETLAGRPGNLPEVTGARGARVLGAVHAPGRA
jgi:anhydro-N-acetylmuramic acid kinase